MHFKITARTILQLGSELISSDAIAFYELIKNAFDAGSKRVEVRIVKRLEHSFIQDCFATIEERVEKEEYFEDEDVVYYKNLILKNTLSEYYNPDLFKKRLNRVENIDDIIHLLKKANYILFKDQGQGMSLEDLDEIYLTVGTTNRKKQRERDPNPQRPILGEKGIGRLSVMRLGDEVRIETTQNGDSYFQELEIDWEEFADRAEELLESILIEPKVGKEKEDVSEHGTRIFIYNLKGDWTAKKLREIADTQLTKFIDPFEKKHRDFIKLWFNNDAIVLGNIDKKLFEYAHAFANARLTFDDLGQPEFTGEITYRLYNRTKNFTLSGTHMASVLNNPRYIELLKSLGPFQSQLYWYNRQLLTKKNGVLEFQYIRSLVDSWGGGLMLYRDGFRVNPYGGPNDDWLGLDPIALASQGYKLNRKQFVGKVDISSYGNSMLIDQTNREGLRENNEKQALVSLLQYMIQEQIRPFMDDVKEQYQRDESVLNLNDIENRIEQGQIQVRDAVNLLKKKYPEIEKEKEVLNVIETVLKESKELFNIARLSSKALETRLKTTIDLAGLGLMVDVIGHELKRSTEHALSTLGDIDESSPGEIDGLLSTLRTQLKTLKTRLAVIDPLGPAGRQQKEDLDLKKLLRDIIESHDAQFQRHQIDFSLVDDSKNERWPIRAVPGMIVQIIENLFSNSVYWIKQQQRIDRNYRPKIIIELDRINNTISFCDNGPGIPASQKEEVFKPFFSTKPPGDGKGLGLYISKEIAQYHKADLFLLDDKQRSNLHTFILSLNN
ncbi:Histidine kinase-, DNA gyrase B-, and HSP90-like ATPase [Mucilaginibacter pineti]|uniref:histidine kinase n=1 Tax=Mucilaginibacter pineti TaxID=1391627 RepID=A0A1G7IK37_9SPHI|nr:sensor histidine kinase [Mucilaginibacter pineti]SDF13120.1 Histidine kinase-, DNA gyrase B-, and HSP90-like ATPase [Mucilaginibacter pineti]